MRVIKRLLGSNKVIEYDDIEKLSMLDGELDAASMDGDKAIRYDKDLLSILTDPKAIKIWCGEFKLETKSFTTETDIRDIRDIVSKRIREYKKFYKYHKKILTEPEILELLTSIEE